MMTRFLLALLVIAAISIVGSPVALAQVQPAGSNPTLVTTLRSNAAGARLPGADRETVDPGGPHYPLDFGDVEAGTCSGEIYVEITNTFPWDISYYVVAETDSFATWFSSPVIGTVVVAHALSETFVPFRFCPQAAGDAHLNVYFFPTDNRFKPGVVQLVGRGVIHDLSAPPDVHFSVSVPGCDLDTIVVVNTSGHTLTVDALWIDDTTAGFHLYTNNVAGTSIEPGGVFFAIVNFCADESGGRETSLKLRYSGGAEDILVTRLIGEARGDSLYRLDRRLIDFGRVAVGECRTDTVLFTNTGRYALTLGPHVFYHAPNTSTSPVFRMVMPDPFSELIVRAGESRPLVFQYCPQDTGIDMATSIGLMRDTYPQTQVQIELRGEAIDTSTGRVWLDQNQLARVGQPVFLTIHLDAGQSVQKACSWNRVSFSFDHTSLHFKRAFVAGLAGSAIAITLDDRVVTVSPSSMAMSRLHGDTVVTLEFVGLSTGQFENIIKLTELEFNDSDSITLDGVGSILLEGCDVGRGLVLSTKGTIRTVEYHPGAPAARVQYHAPQGAVPVITIVDASGAVVRTIELPFGVDTDEWIEIPFDDLPPGFYLIRLRAGDDASIAPILIGQ